MSSLESVIADNALKIGTKFGAELAGLSATGATIIASAVGLIVSTILALSQGKAPPTATYHFSLALPAGTYPTVGAGLLAAQTFVAPGFGGMSTDGAIVLSATTDPTDPGAKQILQNALLQEAHSASIVNDALQKMLAPFYLQLQNLDAEALKIMVESVIKPPLVEADQGVCSDVNFSCYDIFHAQDISLLNATMPIPIIPIVQEKGSVEFVGLKYTLEQGFWRLANIFNDVFLRRLYISPMDQVVQVAGTEIAGTTPGSTVSVGSSFLPLAAIAALVFALRK